MRSRPPWSASSCIWSASPAARRAIGCGRRAGGPSTARTALVMPIYHEDPVRVAARLAAVYRSLADTGRLAEFDLFILSDSRNRDVVQAEQVMWARLCAELGAAGRLFYRVRADNEGRKAGNIAEFCRNWGAGYRYFIVLDADSVMTGATLVHLVELMEANPSRRPDPDRAAAGRRQHAVRPHPAVRGAALRPLVRDRHGVLVPRPQQLLGPQRDHPYRAPSCPAPGCRSLPARRRWAARS